MSQDVVELYHFNTPNSWAQDQTVLTLCLMIWDIGLSGWEVAPPAFVPTGLGKVQCLDCLKKQTLLIFGVLIFMNHMQKPRFYPWFLCHTCSAILLRTLLFARGSPHMGQSLFFLSHCSQVRCPDWHWYTWGLIITAWMNHGHDSSNKLAETCLYSCWVPMHGLA